MILVIEGIPSLRIHVYVYLPKDENNYFMCLLCVDGGFCKFDYINNCKHFYTTIIKAMLMEHDFMQVLAQSNPGPPYHHCLQNIKYIYMVLGKICSHPVSCTLQELLKINT